MTKQPYPFADGAPPHKIMSLTFVGGDLPIRSHDGIRNIPHSNEEMSAAQGGN